MTAFGPSLGEAGSCCLAVGADVKAMTRLLVVEWSSQRRRFYAHRIL